MKYAHSLSIVLLAFTVFACSNDSDDNHGDTRAYIPGQACPENLTYDGICDGKNVVFCNNKGVVEVKNCETKCMVKKSYTEPFAECYYECGDVDYKGKCVEGGFNYCNETEGLIHITCDNGKFCGLKGDVYACI